MGSKDDLCWVLLGPVVIGSRPMRVLVVLVQIGGEFSQIECDQCSCHGAELGFVVEVAEPLSTKPKAVSKGWSLKYCMGFAGFCSKLELRSMTYVFGVRDLGPSGVAAYRFTWIIKL